MRDHLDRPPSEREAQAWAPGLDCRSAPQETLSRNTGAQTASPSLRPASLEWAKLSLRALSRGLEEKRGSSPLTPLPGSKRGKEKKKEVQKLRSGTVVCNCYQTFEKQETTKK